MMACLAASQGSVQTTVVVQVGNVTLTTSSSACDKAATSSTGGSGISQRRAAADLDVGSDAPARTRRQRLLRVPAADDGSKNADRSGHVLSADFLAAASPLLIAASDDSAAAFTLDAGKGAGRRNAATGTASGFTANVTFIITAQQIADPDVPASEQRNTAAAALYEQLGLLQANPDTPGAVDPAVSGALLAFASRLQSSGLATGSSRVGVAVAGVSAPSTPILAPPQAAAATGIPRDAAASPSRAASGQTVRAASGSGSSSKSGFGGIIGGALAALVAVALGATAACLVYRRRRQASAARDRAAQGLRTRSKRVDASAGSEAHRGLNVTSNILRQASSRHGTAPAHASAAAAPVSTRGALSASATSAQGGGGSNPLRAAAASFVPVPTGSSDSLRIGSGGVVPADQRPARLGGGLQAAVRKVAAAQRLAAGSSTAADPSNVHVDSLPARELPPAPTDGGLPAAVLKLAAAQRLAAGLVARHRLGNAAVGAAADRTGSTLAATDSTSAPLTPGTRSADAKSTPGRVGARAADSRGGGLASAVRKVAAAQRLAAGTAAGSHGAQPQLPAGFRVAKAGSGSTGTHAFSAAAEQTSGPGEHSALPPSSASSAPSPHVAAALTAYRTPAQAALRSVSTRGRGPETVSVRLSAPSRGKQSFGAADNGGGSGGGATRHGVSAASASPARRAVATARR